MLEPLRARTPVNSGRRRAAHARDGAMLCSSGATTATNLPRQGAARRRRACRALRRPPAPRSSSAPRRAAGRTRRWVRWSCTTPLVDNVLGRGRRRATTSGRATTSTPPRAPRWRAVHDEQMAAARAGEASARVAFIGDADHRGLDPHGLLGVAAAVGGAAGGGGDLARVVWKIPRREPRHRRRSRAGPRLARAAGLLAPLKQVRVVVMLIGTNDLGNGEMADVALAELKVLLQQVHAALPAARILTMAVFPRGGDEGVPRTPSWSRSGWWSAAANNHQRSTRSTAGVEQFAAAAPYATRRRPQLRLRAARREHAQHVHPGRACMACST